MFDNTKEKIHFDAGTEKLCMSCRMKVNFESPTQKAL